MDHNAADFKWFVDRIREDNPAAAQRVAQTIYKGVAALRTLPNRGRIVEDQVHVLRIRHAAQDWA